MWVQRDRCAERRKLECDNDVWKLLHSGRYDIREVPVDGVVPVDVDTWQDYEALLAGDPSLTHDQRLTHDRSRTNG